MPEMNVFGGFAEGNQTLQEDPMKQAVKSYKEAMRTEKQDLDVEFLKRTLSAVNDGSPLKVACNPIGKDRLWRRDAKLLNVRALELDDEGHLVVHTRTDKTELPVEKALDQLQKLKRKLQPSGPVMLQVSETKQVRITDAYSHAFVKSAWAGLPFDLVLAYFEDEPEE